MEHVRGAKHRAQTSTEENNRQREKSLDDLLNSADVISLLGHDQISQLKKSLDCPTYPEFLTTIRNILYPTKASFG